MLGLKAGIILHNEQKYILLHWLILGCLVILGLAGCKPAPSPVVPSNTAAPGTTPVATDTSPGATLAPSATSLPLAAKVNGCEISLAEYQSELAQYQAAKGTELAPEDKQRVLDDLIDQALLAQAAQEKGFTVDEAMLQERIQRLTSDLGDDQALQTWLTTYRYDEQSFQRALARSIGAAWMRDQIAADCTAGCRTGPCPPDPALYRRTGGRDLRAAQSR